MDENDFCIDSLSFQPGAPAVAKNKKRREVPSWIHHVKS